MLVILVFIFLILKIFIIVDLGLVKFDVNVYIFLIRENFFNRNFFLFLCIFVILSDNGMLKEIDIVKLIFGLKIQ